MGQKQTLDHRWKRNALSPQTCFHSFLFPKGIAGPFPARLFWGSLQHWVIFLTNSLDHCVSDSFWLWLQVMFVCREESSQICFLFQGSWSWSAVPGCQREGCTWGHPYILIMESKTVWKLQLVVADLNPSVIWAVERGHWTWYPLCQDQVEVCLARLLCHHTYGIFTRRYLCCKACKGRLTVWLPGVTPFWNLALAVILSHTGIYPYVLFHTGRPAFAGEKPEWKYLTTFSQTPKINGGGKKPKPAWVGTENGSLWSCMEVL